MSTFRFNDYPRYPLAFDHSIRAAGVAEQLGFVVGGDVDACYYKYKIEHDPEPPPGPAIEPVSTAVGLGSGVALCTFFEGAPTGRVTVALPDGRRLTRVTEPATQPDGHRFGELVFRLAPGDPVGVYRVSLETRDGLAETAFEVSAPEYTGVSVLNLFPSPVPHALPPNETTLQVGVFGYPGEPARTVHIYEATDPQQAREGADYVNTIEVPLDDMGNGGAVLPLTQTQAGRTYILWCGDQEQLDDPLVGSGAVPDVSSFAESAIAVIPAA